MKKTLVLNVVGLTRKLLGPHTPALQRLADQGACLPIQSVLPAVTCSVQSTYLTGLLPSEHGIVGNGWYNRDECDVRFWRQSNRLVQGDKLWDLGRQRDDRFTCANLFWWYNMYSSVDLSATPRPMYPADGRKIPDLYTRPPVVRKQLQTELGPFPLFRFWGPAAGIEASQWIAESAQWIDREFSPSLNLVYLPHLDYCLQRLGPDDPAIAKELRAIDALCGTLIAQYEAQEANIIVLSEYGISPVTKPVHLNRILRQAGLLTVREELGCELLDAGASAAFAVADHQSAHIYVADPARVPEVKKLLEGVDGVALVLDEAGKADQGLAHDRAGELVAVAQSDAWFTYYYWLNDERAPDFARTVDIHRKPGYDPVELFLDPALRIPKLSIGLRLLRKSLGFRTLMDVIPLDASLVKGSHGARPAHPDDGAVFISNRPALIEHDELPATSICGMILQHVSDR